MNLSGSITIARMCGNCEDPSCGCPSDDDQITMCGCEKGIHCHVCGHDPIGASSSGEQDEASEA